MYSHSYMSKIFGSSPVQPMQHHMGLVCKCVDHLRPFFEHVISNNWDAARQTLTQIRALENEADEVKKEIRLNLPKGIFMPVSRIDLLEMLRIQDLVANRAKDIAGLVCGRELGFPEQTTDLLSTLIERSIASAYQARKAINELDELVETGFRGAEVKLVQSMIKELDSIENETDRIQVDLRYQIYQIEDDLPPVNVMFLYKVIEWIGDVADYAQRVGSRLEYLLAR